MSTTSGRGQYNAIFLDRDGTLVHARHYPSRPEQLILFDDIAAPLRDLQRTGFKLIVITNQAGLAHGYFSATDLDAMHVHLRAELLRHDIQLHAIYHCPHHPDGVVSTLAIACPCRKPQPGLLLRAAADHDLDLSRSWMVGDILHDVEAGNRAGCRTVLVNNGGETEWIDGPFRTPDWVVGSTREALTLIGEREGVTGWQGDRVTNLFTLSPCHLDTRRRSVLLSNKTQIPAEWQAARRILLVRLDNLGDVLVTTPAFHAVRRSLPQAELTLLASPVGAQVGRLNPDLDDVIVYQSPQMDPWGKLPHDSEREQRMIALLRERRFDGAIIFTSFRQSSLPQAYLCYLADIPLRAAASIDGPGSLLTTRHKHPDRMMHEVERGLDLVGALGMTTDELDLVLRVPEEFQVSSSRFLVGMLQQRETRNLKPETPLVVIHPGCTMPARTYPWEMFARVADLLVERIGALVLLTGTADERDLCDQIINAVQPDRRHGVVSLAGELPFDRFCALIDAADLVITNNTGPMHMAAALKTPVVALFALTNPPEQWGPWRVPSRVLFHDVPCRICYSRVCPYAHECLRLVSPEMVLEAAASLLEEPRTKNQEPGQALPSPVLGLPGGRPFLVLKEAQR